jgi:hypothetical protein
MRESMGVRRCVRLGISVGAAALVSGLAAGSAQASRAHALKAHGQLLRLATGSRANAGQSNNWFGYNQGSLEQGHKLFRSISGNWTVPAATQHTKGHAEDSSDWVGIGGGCVNTRCTAGDPTLIQTGTEQDVSSAGTPSYSAWWEVIPGPSLTITKLKVRPGDRMHASISEVLALSNLWKISIRDLTRHESYSTTVPYTSTHDTAEWIEETPLILGSKAGFAALPRLTSPAFDLAKTNGKPANLRASEEIDLVDSSGKVIGTPSAPDPDHDGFNACTWAGTCTVPTRS